jgi:hypothetical protein
MRSKVVRIYIFILVAILAVLFRPARALEVLESPLTSRLGIGAGVRAESQYGDMTPTLYSGFSISGDFRWREFQSLLEWTRWSESSQSGTLAVSHRQDLFSLFGRAEILKDSWLGLFVGPGIGFQQDTIQTTFYSQKRTSNGDLATFYGGEAGATFYLWPKFEAQLSGRVIYSPVYQTHWTQWLMVRVAYQIF